MAQNQIFALVLFLSATLSTFLFIFALNKRPMPGAIALTLFGASQVWWSLTYAIYWLQLKGEPNLFWLDMTYFGVVTSPAIFFAFTVIFTQRATWLFPRHAFLLAIMPTLTMLILFTDPWHGLFYGGARSATSSLIYSGGIWFWVNAIYSYLLIIVSLYFLAIAYLQADPLKKKQIGILFLGGLCPVLGTLVSFFKINPIPNLDLTPILFTLTCLIYSYGFFWYRLLDILPIARNKVVENMTEGLLVLEKGNRILDINRSARELLNLPHLKARGQDASLILPFWDHISKAMGNAQQEKIIQKIHTVPDRFVELQITPLYEKETDLIGNVIVIRDQTERIHFENELKQANLDLQQKLGEIAILQEKLREQAIRDSLTGLFNRHFLDEALNIEISKADRSGKPIGIIFGDVDNFKQINDSYGHHIGDKVLHAIASLIMSNVRSGDIACRAGGDEFILILPDTPLQICAQRAEELCTKIAGEPFHLNDIIIMYTVSLGVVSYPEHCKTRDDILRLVDQALYQSKKAGRNRITIHQPHGSPGNTLLFL